MEKIVFLDRGTLSVPVRKPNFPHEWVDFDRTAPEETVKHLLGATIAVTNKVKIRLPELEQLPLLRFIGIVATGYDCVDVAAAGVRGIKVSNVPGYTGASVPEHVMMLILALRRNLLPFHQAVQTGAWSRAPHFTMLDYPIDNLAGSVLGLVGYGRLAQEVEKRARAFGMEIVIAERKGAMAVRTGRQAFEDVLRHADVVSLHSPLSDETRGMIGAKELALMKPTALLINTARGGLIDEAALASALTNKRLGGAGIDVLSQEPPPATNPLVSLHLPNLIVTPHNAWTSRQAQTVLAEEVIKNLEAFAAGKPRNLVS